jgi:hypothetical protein
LRKKKKENKYKQINMNSYNKPIVSTVDQNNFCPNSSENLKLEFKDKILYFCNTNNNNNNQPEESKENNNTTNQSDNGNGTGTSTSQLAGWGFMNRGFGYGLNNWSTFPRVGFGSFAYPSTFGLPVSTFPTAVPVPLVSGVNTLPTLFPTFPVRYI